MLASAIIIFREMFEIVLIVGIILAATKSLEGRMKWILSGLGLGLAGAALIALFIDKISEVAEGLGQEIFNAAVLYSAAFLIGGTVLWMVKHGREIRSHFNHIGQNIFEGKLHFFSLSMAIALAIWREGAEIIMFIYGMIASNQPVINITLGAAGGGLAGLIVGLLIYFGLLKIPTKYFFRVTTGILVLLVAGMVSGGTGYMISAGIFTHMTSTAWDTSEYLSQTSIAGQALHALLGYSEQPAILQVILYVLTILVFAFIIYSPKFIHQLNLVKNPWSL
jgi:high-affinity iron transporter